MSWLKCTVCDGIPDAGDPDVPKPAVPKHVNYHEPSGERQFRVIIHKQCRQTEAAKNGLEALENKRKEAGTVEFYVDLAEIGPICPEFQKFEGQTFVEIATNCQETKIVAPAELTEISIDCSHAFKASLNPKHFHAFLEAVCPSLYGIRPVPITMSNIVPVVDILAHFHSEPLLTNCERVLMSTNIAALDMALLIRLLDKGLSVCLDHRILGRILCVCLMNASKLADVSQELTGTVGCVFAQAFVANVAKNFKHIKPLEQDRLDKINEPLRQLMGPTTSSGGATASGDSKKRKSRRNRRESQCDHSEEGFECILCFDKRCGKCKGEGAFCYKALDNFLYEVRLQLYPHTYRAHLDRDLLREDRVNDYILHHQLQPLQPLPI